MKDPTRLERLLDLKVEEERQRSYELAMARQAASDAQKALEMSLAQRREVEARTMGAAESVGDMMTTRLLLEQVDQAIERATEVLREAIDTVEEKHEQFLAASQDREALERVVVPRRQQTQMLNEMAEQKRQDEEALTHYRTGRSKSQ